jgi:hypothetical protein
MLYIWVCTLLYYVTIHNNNIFIEVTDFLLLLLTNGISSSHQRGRLTLIHRKCLSVTNIWSWAPDEARHQDRLNDRRLQRGFDSEYVHLYQYHPYSILPWLQCSVLWVLPMSKFKDTTENPNPNFSDLRKLCLLEKNWLLMAIQRVRSLFVNIKLFCSVFCYFILEVPSLLLLPALSSAIPELTNEMWWDWIARVLFPERKHSSDEFFLWYNAT